MSLDYLDATDDGVVFITGPQPRRDKNGELGVGYGASAVWFTDGSTPVRIGTTSGSAVRGFGIATSVSGSTLAWKEPGDETSETLAEPFGPVVVYDTGTDAGGWPVRGRGLPTRSARCTTTSSTGPRTAAPAT